MHIPERETFCCRHGVWHICTTCHGTKEMVIEMPNDEYWLNGMKRSCYHCGGVGWTFDFRDDYGFLRYSVRGPCECLEAYLASRKRRRFKVVAGKEAEPACSGMS